MSIDAIRNYPKSEVLRLSKAFNTIKNHVNLGDVIYMCFVDTSTNVDIDPDELQPKDVVCSNCGSKFKAIGSKAVCPTCESEN